MFVLYRCVFVVLGARGSRILDHGLEHLRGANHRLAGHVAARNHHLLSQKNLERHSGEEGEKKRQAGREMIKKCQVSEMTSKKLPSERGGVEEDTKQKPGNQQVGIQNLGRSNLHAQITARNLAIKEKKHDVRTHTRQRRARVNVSERERNGASGRE